jgi:anti-anti-sigma factor
VSRLAISIATPDDQRSESGLSETFAVRGELDIASASILEHALIDELTAIPDEIVLGLGELAFIDIAGFRALEGVRAHLAAHGCRLTLRSVPSQAARLLELAARAMAAKRADHLVHSTSRRPTQSSWLRAATAHPAHEGEAAEPAATHMIHLNEDPESLALAELAITS